MLRVTVLSLGIVFKVEVLMHVPCLLPKIFESSGALVIKRVIDNSALLSHSSGYLHTQEGTLMPVDPQV